MLDRFRALRSAAPFWSLRVHESTSEVLSVRQDTVEPPRLSVERGAMLTAVVEGGQGYCATGDLSAAGLQAALDRATEWAQAARGRSVPGLAPAAMPSPRGEYEAPARGGPADRKALLELLAAECARAKVDERIVERHAALERVDEERLYFTSAGNVKRVQVDLPVPIALEPIAALFDWPDEELTEGQFLTEILDRTGALLLLDIANVYANAVNRGEEPTALLDQVPLERIAYVHVAGGEEHDGIYHDTHTDPTPAPVLDLVRELCSRRRPPALLLERDGRYPPAADLTAELDAIAAAAGVAPITTAGVAPMTTAGGGVPMTTAGAPITTAAGVAPITTAAGVAPTTAAGGVPMTTAGGAPVTAA
jgi:hypothetical protein